MNVIRGVVIAVWWMAGCSVALANKPGDNPLAANLAYWEQQPQSAGRDSTLIRLYAHYADLTASPDSALVLLQKGFKIAFKLRSSAWLAFTHNRIGLVYLRKGVNFEAIKYFFKGLQYAEIAKKTPEQAFSWDYIADCYANLKNYNKAILAEKTAIDLYRKNNNVLRLASSLNDLGAILSASNQLPASIAALEQSLHLNNTLQNPDLLVGTYHTLATTLLKKGDFEEAKRYIQLAIHAQKKTKGRASAELLALMSLIEARRHQLTESLKYAAQAELYLAYEWPSIQEQVAIHLFETYKALQKPSAALQWHEKYVALRDNNMQAVQEKRIEMLRYEYDAQQRDTQMQRMADDISREGYIRWILISASAVFLLLAAVLYRSNFLLRAHRKELDATNGQLLHMGELLKQTNTHLEDRVAARTNELQAANHSLMLKNHEIQEALFRGQSLERKRVATELHDNLGSLLSVVKWRLESIDMEALSHSEQALYEGVVKLITDAYNQVRHISHNLLPSILEEQGLISALEKLTADLNQSGKLTCEVLVAKDVLIEDKKVAFELYSCALELMTNILKHAAAWHVVIELVQTQGFHILMITDDGVGIHRAPGQGLGNIRQRVESLDGKFSIRSLKNNQGTAVTLRIPRQATLVS